MYTARAAVLVGVGMVVVVVVVVFTFVMAVGVLHAVGVAVSSFVVVTGFGILSNVLGEAPSHFTRKCKTRVGHEATTAGELLSRFLYHSSASEFDLQ